MFFDAHRVCCCVPADDVCALEVQPNLAPLSNLLYRERVAMSHSALQARSPRSQYELVLATTAVARLCLAQSFARCTCDHQSVLSHLSLTVVVCTVCVSVDLLLKTGESGPRERRPQRKAHHVRL